MMPITVSPEFRDVIILIACACVALINIVTISVFICYIWRDTCGSRTKNCCSRWRWRRHLKRQQRQHDRANQAISSRLNNQAIAAAAEMANAMIPVVAGAAGMVHNGPGAAHPTLMVQPDYVTQASIQPGTFSQPTMATPSYGYPGSPVGQVHSAVGMQSPFSNAGIPTVSYGDEAPHNLTFSTTIPQQPTPAMQQENPVGYVFASPFSTGSLDTFQPGTVPKRPRNPNPLMQTASSSKLYQTRFEQNREQPLKHFGTPVVQTISAQNLVSPVTANLVGMGASGPLVYTTSDSSGHSRGSARKDRKDKPKSRPPNRGRMDNTGLDTRTDAPLYEERKRSNDAW